MSTEIYYFSGTGNSLFVARELQHRIPGAKLIPIISLLNSDAIKTTAETVGIVFLFKVQRFLMPLKGSCKRLN